MLFVTGPMFAGKREWVCAYLGWGPEELGTRAALEVQDLIKKAEDPETLAEQFSRFEVVTASEVGCGVVPTDAGERQFREAAGRLSCLLARRADTVVRVCCGLPQVLKGTLS